MTDLRTSILLLQKADSMERKWLEKFYAECGRETTLAYNVLNYSNNWGVTLITGIMATVFLGSLSTKDGVVSFSYPTLYHWLFVIIGWIIMLRFFTRSALALANLYRWNKLNVAIAKLLSLSEYDPLFTTYEKNCVKTIREYYFNWSSPIKRRKLIWSNLKLMYLWPFLLIMVLFIWGICKLEWNIYFFIGMALFIIPLIIEMYFFLNWHGLKYAKVDLDDEPKIADVWIQNMKSESICSDEIMILGFCSNGPYRRTQDILANSEIQWIPWHYNAKFVSHDLIDYIYKKRLPDKQKIAFTSWPKDFIGEVSFIRTGYIDHYSFNGKTFTLGIKLDDLAKNLTEKKVKVLNSDILCFLDKVKAD